MKNKLFWQRAGAVLFALVLWQFAAMALGQQLLLVTPVKVAGRLAELVRESAFWQTVGFSFWRIVAGFLLALIAGAVLGALSARVHAIEVLLWPFIVAVKSVPVASFIILSLIWLQASSLSVFISFLMVFPVVYFNTLQGMQATDRQLVEMAHLFKVPWRRRLLYIYLPQLQQILLSACSVALGMSWKAGIAAEVIGIPSGSIGEQLYEAKVYLSTADLLSWTVVIVLVSVLFEKLFITLLKRAFAGLERL